MKPRYSGKKSIRFWERVNATENESQRHELYLSAVALQNLEAVVLRKLREAENARPQAVSERGA